MRLATVGPRNRLRERLRGTAPLWGLLLLVTWFLLLAPTQVGGRATLTVIYGHSMRPMLSAGDLAIAHRHTAYQIGELVVFGHESGNVIHRIVGGSATAGWQTKGDNNAWVDPWVVPDAAIRGAYVGHVPAVGFGIAWVARHPLQFAFATALAAAAAAVAVRQPPRRSRQRSPHPPGTSHGRRQRQRWRGVRTIRSQPKRQELPAEPARRF